MQNLIKLTYFEIKQMLRYWLVVGLIFLLSTLFFVVKFLIRNNRAPQPIPPQSMYGNIISVGAILGILAMVIACFIIWYKDWNGASHMITRWLSAPLKRSDLYWAKKLSLIYYFMVMLALVFFTVYFYHLMFSLFLGKSYLSETPIHLIFHFNSLFSSFLTNHWLLSILQILAWLSLIAYFFLGILIERAYSWWQALIYIAVVLLIIVGCWNIPGLFKIPAYFNLQIPLLIACIVIGVLADWIANHLVMPKIHI